MFSKRMESFVSVTKSRASRPGIAKLVFLIVRDLHDIPFTIVVVLVGENSQWCGLPFEIFHKCCKALRACICEHRVESDHRT